MKQYKLLQQAAAGIAGLGLLLPQAARAAQPVAPMAPVAIQAAHEAHSVVDVALLDGGVLQGQVVDGAGSPIGGTLVVVETGGQQVATTRTTAEGYFAVKGLRGGMYQVSSAGGTGVYRLWSATSAPPAANDGVLVVSGEQTARGQMFRGNPRMSLLMLGLLGGIVTAGLIADHEHHHGS